MGRANGLDTGTAHSEYGWVNFAGAASDAVGARTTMTPDVELRATKLVVKLTAAPGSTRYFVLRVNGVDRALKCVVSGAQTGCEGDDPVTIPPSCGERAREPGPPGRAFPANPRRAGVLAG